MSESSTPLFDFAVDFPLGFERILGFENSEPVLGTRSATFVDSNGLVT